MLHLEQLAREYEKDTIRKAEQRRQIEEALAQTTSSSPDFKTPTRKLKQLLVVSGLKLVGWHSK
ncbi:MAG: hypothetical protein KDJ65_17670 [Anaerolineae bacterium]|nr:hypothetical protein [Anaerolineae bacterium]